MKLIPFLAVALVLAQAGAGGAQDPLLVPAGVSRFDVGSPSGQVLLADLNGDRDLDLLTLHQEAGAIRVHLGDGQAAFTTSGTIALSFRPGAMEVGDVNGDTFLDLVVTATDRDVVDVVLGKGNGAFVRAKGSPFMASAQRYRFNKRSLHLLDVNEDRRLDIVTANRRGQFAFPIWLGDGRGRFVRGPVLTVAPAREGYTLAFGDVNGDRHVDVVTAVSSPVRGRVDVHLGNGRGTFTNLRGPAVSLSRPYRVEALADVNADRRPDVVLNHRDASVTVLLNSRGGRFAPAAGSPFVAPARPFALRVTDLDRDGDVDLVGATTGSVAALLGDRGRFPRARQSSFRAGPGAYNVAVGDINGDGRADVVASSFESTAVTVLLGR